MPRTDSAHLRINSVASHLAPSPTSSLATTTINSINGIDDHVSLFPDKKLLPAHPKIPLTKEQIKQYTEEGYFVIPGLVTGSEIETYISHFIKICRGEVDRQDMLVMRDVLLAKQLNKGSVNSEEQVTKIQDWQNDDVLMSYVRDEKILDYVTQLIGTNVRSIHTMLINKPPDLGKGTSVHPMHQDLLYFPFRPANRIVAAWTALEVIDETNGCLCVIPGSHKLTLLPHHEPELANKAYQAVRQNLVDFYLNDLNYRSVPLHMQPGDTVLFHPNLVHGSGPNLSKRYRKAISCHYASGFCTFSDIPKHNYGLIDELIPVLERKFGFKKEHWTDEEKLEAYHLVWRAKSRQILGEEQNDWEVKPISFLK